MVLVPLSPGEVVDRVVILDLKCARIGDPALRARAEQIRGELVGSWTAASLPPIPSLPEFAALGEVNAALWDVEDALRAHERAGTFGEAFVALARSVYVHNDRRAALKQAIDDRLGSSLSEPKWYPLQSGT
jgi:hypothetical protein